VNASHKTLTLGGRPAAIEVGYSGASRSLLLLITQREGNKTI
jgi:hypothetical protein